MAHAGSHAVGLTEITRPTPVYRSPTVTIWESMTEQSFYLVADVSSDDPAAIEQVLRNHVQGQITRLADGFHVEAEMHGSSARELNRMLLSALRVAHRKTRLRSEWTSAGVTHRFFDYVPKETRSAAS